MERSVSVSSDQNIQDHLWRSEYSDRNWSKFAVPFLTNRFFAQIREFGKRQKNGKSRSYWLTYHAIEIDIDID